MSNTADPSQGTQAQKAAGACARVARWPVNNNPKLADTPETSDSEKKSLMATQHPPICIDTDLDDNCRYTSGVNVHLDSEQEENMEGSDKWSDTESWKGKNWRQTCSQSCQS